MESSDRLLAEIAQGCDVANEAEARELADALASIRMEAREPPAPPPLRARTSLICCAPRVPAPNLVDLPGAVLAIAGAFLQPRDLGALARTAALGVQFATDGAAFALGHAPLLPDGEETHLQLYAHVRAATAAAREAMVLANKEQRCNEALARSRPAPLRFPGGVDRFAAPLAEWLVLGAPLPSALATEPVMSPPAAAPALAAARAWRLCAARVGGTAMSLPRQAHAMRRLARDGLWEVATALAEGALGHMCSLDGCNNNATGGAGVGVGGAGAGAGSVADTDADAERALTVTALRVQATEFIVARMYSQTFVRSGTEGEEDNAALLMGLDSAAAAITLTRQSGSGRRLRLMLPAALLAHGRVSALYGQVVAIGTMQPRHGSSASSIFDTGRASIEECLLLLEGEQQQQQQEKEGDAEGDTVLLRALRHAEAVAALAELGYCQAAGSHHKMPAMAEALLARSVHGFEAAAGALEPLLVRAIARREAAAAKAAAAEVAAQRMRGTAAVPTGRGAVEAAAAASAAQRAARAAAEFEDDVLRVHARTAKDLGKVFSVCALLPAEPAAQEHNRAEAARWLGVALAMMRQAGAGDRHPAVQNIERLADFEEERRRIGQT